MRNRPMEELYAEEVFYWSIVAMDTRVLNKVRVEDSVAVLFAACAINSWISGDVEGGNMYKSWLGRLRRFGKRRGRRQTKGSGKRS